LKEIITAWLIGGCVMVSVEDFYRDAQREWARRDLPVCRIEFASTLNLIDVTFREPDE
jgi:hypothetical protein